MFLSCKICLRQVNFSFYIPFQSVRVAGLLFEGKGVMPCQSIREMSASCFCYCEDHRQTFFWFSLSFIRVSSEGQIFKFHCRRFRSSLTSMKSSSLLLYIPFKSDYRHIGSPLKREKKHHSFFFTTLLYRGICMEKLKEFTALFASYYFYVLLSKR